MLGTKNLRQKGKLLSLFLVTIFVLSLFPFLPEPVTAEATSYKVNYTVRYDGNLSDAQLRQILTRFGFPSDVRIIRPGEPVEQAKDPKPQPPEDPKPQPPEDPKPQPPEDPKPQPPEDPKPQPPKQSEPDPGNVLTAEEQEMLNLVNQERVSRGLPALKVNPELVKLARLKSADMVKYNYFSHQSPTYGSPFDMMRNAGVSYRTAGENIAGAPSVARAHNGLMNSAGHRANILSSSFNEVGIGIVDGGPYGKMFTQMFIGR